LRDNLALECGAGDVNGPVDGKALDLMDRSGD
jgi:hypothetical protein